MEFMQFALILAAVPIFFFMPGYLSARILFTRIELFDLITLSFTLSIAWITAAAFFLTILQALIGVGITSITVWGAIMTICLAQGMALLR